MSDRDGAADGVIIRRYQTEAEARAAAAIMAGTEPWTTLGRSAEQTYRNVTLPQQESYVAVVGAGAVEGAREEARGGAGAGGEVVGVVIVALPVLLIKGYISGLAVRADYRNRGMGTRLMAVAEERIFRESPNVFLCVSSFNPAAKRFYERLGYRQVGELTELIVAGHSEFLMRKTRGPWSTFRAAETKRAE